METKMSDYIKHIIEIEKIKKEADKLMVNKISKYEKEIKELKDRLNAAETETALIKATGMNSPEMINAKKELEEVKADNKKLAQQIEDLLSRLDKLRHLGIL